MELPKAYIPSDYEGKIYKDWEKKKLFNPDTLKRKGKPFSIVLPPPNVTAILHLGSASMLSIEDLMIRYKRMRGFDTVWVPGSDHAGIATQNVVEKKLLKEKKLTRHDLGREKFLLEVEKYVDTVQNTFQSQMRRMGASMDWSREAYTLDETRNKAVRKVFKMMHDDGLIYRGNRIVNWCPRCKSTLADDEVEYKKEKTKFYTFKYSPDFPLEISSTRPETKLGDTAVAVHPQDPRYKKFVGQEFKTRFCGVPLKIKIIADRAVDREFGTGALGVTPSHSKIDWEMAEKNNLEKVKVINEDGNILPGFGTFSGMSAAEARASVVEELRKQGLLVKEEDIEHDISVCYRCATPIEPLPSLQWFVNVNKKTERLKNGKTKKSMSLKEKALEVVKNGEIKIIPERFNKIYFDWMDNLHDWCISRQIWFGHRIPVWYKVPNSKSKIQNKFKDSNSNSEIQQSEIKNLQLIMMRHGEAKNNAANILNSDIKKNNFVLTEKGIEEVNAALKEYKNEKFDAIYCSDFKRTTQTAEIIAKALNLKVIKDKRLREVGIGQFEGKTDKALGNFRSEHFNAWHADSPKGIEPFVSLKNRVYEFLDEAIEKHAGKKILIVTHGDVIRVSQGYGQNLTDEEIFAFKYPNVGGHIELNLTERVQIRVSENPINEAGWRQDEDTLDTWFSSGMWTFSTLLKKNFKDFSKKNNPDLKRFHPTAVLETAYDIIFFWVARMILMTTYVMGEVPFETVYLHGLIRDKDGDKMSKSKPETAIDPVDAADKYGMDAVRLSLLIGNSAGNDLKLYDEKIAGFRNLVNKLWNIGRFILTNPKFKAHKLAAKDFSLSDKWILSRFNKLKADISDLLDKYNFSQAGEMLREFTWNEFADWYLEAAKVTSAKVKVQSKLQGTSLKFKGEGNSESEKILLSILSDLLKLWHPFAPFVTQALFNELGTKEELMISEWPKVDKKLIDKKAEKEFGVIQEVIIKIRNLRSEYKVEPGKTINVAFKTNQQKLIKDNLDLIKTLAKIETVDFVNDKPADVAAALVGKIEIYLSLAGLVDNEKEKVRLEKEKENLANYVSGLEKKLGNVGFVANAPAAVVDGEKAKLAEAKTKLAKIVEQMDLLI